MRVLFVFFSFLLVVRCCHDLFFLLVVFCSHELIVLLSFVVLGLDGVGEAALLRESRDKNREG